MAQSPWSPGTLGKYILLQLPGFLLLIALLLLVLEWREFPRWLLWVVPGLWILKDLLLYRFVWRSYAPESPPPAMVGLPGEARERIDPQGYVRIRGEFWLGELAPGSSPIEAGEKVQVCGQRGLTLIVTREEEGKRS
jgi:membrane-bound ClpP family serine protease